MTAALAATILAELTRRGETLASAESLTGGMLGALITDVPGASASYVGGVISYATSLKAILVGVDSATLAQFGPVAAPTAADAQDDHSVGEVFIAVSHQAGGLLRVQELSLQGDRAAIRKQAAAAALTLLANELGLNGADPEVADASLP